MSNQKLKPALLLAGLFFLFYKVSKSANTDNSGNGILKLSPSDYIKKYFPLAQATQNNYLVPSVFTISQAGLESAWGNSEIARNANNHFGIKADSFWKGPVYNYAVKSGTIVPFRKYNSVQDSYNDHAKFLTTNSRYANAFNYTDPSEFAQSVANAGYSIKPDYYSRINEVINSVKKITQ